MKKYEKESVELLKSIETYRTALSKEELVELIRKTLMIASLDGALESLKEAK